MSSDYQHSIICMRKSSTSICRSRFKSFSLQSPGVLPFSLPVISIWKKAQIYFKYRSVNSGIRIHNNTILDNNEVSNYCTFVKFGSFYCLLCSYIHRHSSSWCFKLESYTWRNGAVCHQLLKWQ